MLKNSAGKLSCSFSHINKCLFRDHSRTIVADHRGRPAGMVETGGAALAQRAHLVLQGLQDHRGKLAVANKSAAQDRQGPPDQKEVPVRPGQVDHPEQGAVPRDRGVQDQPDLPERVVIPGHPVLEGRADPGEPPGQTVHLVPLDLPDLLALEAFKVPPAPQVHPEPSVRPDVRG